MGEETAYHFWIDKRDRFVCGWGRFLAGLKCRPTGLAFPVIRLVLLPGLFLAGLTFLSDVVW